MRQIATESELNELIAAEPAVMVLFGGSHCGVCQAIKPRLMAMARADFPHLAMAWVDCEGAGPLCATQRVFSLPVVQLWFEGQPFDRFVRTFSLAAVRQAIERPYEMLFSARG